MPQAHYDDGAGRNILQLKTFAELSQEEIEQFTQLYRSSFLPVETKPVENVLAMIRNDKRYHLYAAEKDGRILGFSLLYIFEDLGFGLLDYMAVAAQEQRKGIGRLLFQHTLAAFEREVKDPAGLILEVQAEKYASDEKDLLVRKDRLRFYKGLGAKIITEHYLLPPQAGSKPEETYLLLAPSQEIEHITKGVLIQVIKAIYIRVYNYRNDDLLEETISKLPARCDLA